MNMNRFKIVLLATVLVTLSWPVPSLGQTTGSMAPILIHTFLDSSGNPLSGALVDVYLAGGTTRVTTYSESSLTTENANPVVADSAGRATIFLTGGQSYRFDVNTSANVLVYSVDNVDPVAHHTLASTTFGTGAAADVALIWDGNAQDFHIGLDDSVDDLVFGLGSVLGTTPAFAIDENQVTTFQQDPIIAGSTPQLTIGDAGAEDTFLVYDGNAQDFYACLDDTADSYIVGLGSACGTNPAITIIGDGTEDVTLAGDLTVSGVGPHGFGAVIGDNRQITIGGAFTSGGSDNFATNLNIGGSVTGTSGDTVSLSFLRLAGTITTQATDTVTTVASLIVDEPVITVGGSGTVTNSASLYIKTAATEATNDYALWVDAGTTRLDGALDFGAGSTLNSGGADVIYTGSGDSLWINETANANCTTCLLVNQGSADDQALGLKSSDVATVLTTLTRQTDVETDDYFIISKRSATEGGVYITALAESGAAGSVTVEGWGGAPSTTDTSASTGAIQFIYGQHDGANADADMAADSNLFSVAEIDSSNNVLTRLLLKADDGELHLGNNTVAALDAHEDAMAVRGLQYLHAAGLPEMGGIIPTVYDDGAMDYDALYALGVVGERNPDDDGKFLFSVQSRFNLHDGAIWQNYVATQDTTQRVRYLEDELQSVRVELATLKGQVNEIITPRLVAAGR